MTQPTDLDVAGGADTAGHLVLDRDAGGFRHYLEGRPVSCGDALELQVVRRARDDESEWLEPVPGEWVPIRYEAHLTADRAADVRVHLFGNVGGHTARLEFPDGARFRWRQR